MGRRYSKKFKKEVVAASYADGVSAASVARQFEVPDSALYYWRKRYGRPVDKSATSTDAEPVFIPITISPEKEQPVSLKPDQEQKPDTWQVTISMGSDRHVEIVGAFELPDLIKLVRGVVA